MNVAILGPLVVHQGGREVVVGAAKHRELLALLVVQRGKLVTTESVVDALWDGHPPATAVKIVHGYVSALRKILGSENLETRSGGYLLSLASDAVDVAQFELLLAQGRAALTSGNPQEAVPALTDALSLWRGPPLIEFRFRDFAATEINRLDELRLLALDAAFEARLSLGRHAEAIPDLQVVVREHPLCENLHRHLMLALYRAGRQSDALAAYRALHRILVDEQGLEPSDSVRELEAAILARDPALDLPRHNVGRAQQPGDGPRAHSPWRHRRAMTAALAIGAVVVVASLVILVPPSKGSTYRSLPADSIGFIGDHGHRSSVSISLDGPPAAIALGDGSLWAIDSAADTIERIDPATHAVIRTVPTGPDPTGAAFGGGSVWVVNHDSQTVSRISAQTDAVVQTIPVGAGPTAIASGDGSVWVTNSDDRTLSRISAVTGKVTATIRTNAVGAGIAVGGGSVWVSDELTNHLIAVNPNTDTVQSLITVGAGPTSVAFGDGSVWVVNSLDGTVSQVDATTLSVTSTTSVAGGPDAVSASGAEVWVSAELGARIDRINVASGTVATAVRVGNQPVALAASPSGVWAAIQSSGAGHQGGRLIVVGSSVGSLDPSVGDIFPDLAEPLYDGLTGLSRENGLIVPDLATDLPRPTNGGRSYTFRVRPGIRYSNGQPLRAVDFRRGLRRTLEMNGGFADLFRGILGAGQCLDRSRCTLSRGVLVQGLSTVTFRLAKPDSSLLEDLRFLIPVPSGTPARGAGDHPVPGTGPYEITSDVAGKLIDLGRNPYFRVWSAAARPAGYPDDIVYRVASSPAAGAKEVMTGRADVADLASEPPAVSRFAVTHAAQVHVVAQSGVVFVFLNVRRPPFNDVRVRRALSYAIDRAHVSSLDGGSLATPTCQQVPPSVSGYQAYCPYTADPNARGRWLAPNFDKARSLVAASGTAQDRIDLWTFSDFAAEARYVVDVLNRLGYDARVHEITDSGRYFDVLAKHPHAQAGMFGWFGGVLAVDDLAMLSCSSQSNPSHFCNHRVDAQIARLSEREPTDPAGTSALAAKVDREITDREPWVPLFTPRLVDVTSTRVGDFQATLGDVQLDQLWVK